MLLFFFLRFGYCVAIGYLLYSLFIWVPFFSLDLVVLFSQYRHYALAYITPIIFLSNILLCRYSAFTQKYIVVCKLSYILCFLLFCPSEEFFFFSLFHSLVPSFSVLHSFYLYCFHTV